MGGKEKGKHFFNDKTICTDMRENRAAAGSAAVGTEGKRRRRPSRGSEEERGGGNLISVKRVGRIRGEIGEQKSSREEGEEHYCENMRQKTRIR